MHVSAIGRDIVSAFRKLSTEPDQARLVVTVVNIPADLSKAEAERFAQFVRMLALD